MVMRIVILDGYAANPGDLSWDEFTQLGECTIHERTPESEIVKRAMSAEVLLTNKALIRADALTRLPSLRYIGVLATGYNNVDVAAARERGIPVCNVPEYSTPAVAQATFALLLELTNRTGHHAQTVQAGRWTASKDFCYWDGTLIELSGLTLGIIGYGRIGRAVAEIGRAFGMRILTHRRSGSGEPKSTDLDTLFRLSDVISLHCPLTAETKEIVNSARIALMKPTAYLINTARGPLVNEQHLADALNAGLIAGAGLDVLSVEPPGAANPLLQAQNCIITPHFAWAARAARVRLLKIAAENIRAYQRGELQNVVNP
jgi:glycerate dehydrogenase